MHKRYDLLDELITCYRRGTEFKRNDNTVLGKDDVKTLLYKLREYYEMNDLETGKVHSKIFVALCANEFDTYDALSREFYRQPYVLDRYRQRYNKLAEKLLKKAKKR